MAKKSVSKALKNALSGNQTEPQLRDVIGHLIGLFGGPPKFASMLFDEYHQAKPGSLIRQRILDAILRCLWRVNEKAVPLGDMDRLSEEDLEREILLRIKKFDGEEEAKTGAGTEGDPADGSSAAG